MKLKHPTFLYLQRQHKEIIFFIYKLKKQQPGLIKIKPHQLTIKKIYAIEFYYNFLEQHFNNEETKLFPTIKDFLNSEKIILETLINQHNEFKKYIKKIENTLIDRLPAKLKEFALELEEHLKIEEEKLFTYCENVVPPDVLNNIKESFSH